MAKAFEIAALVATVLCFSSLFSLSSANPTNNNVTFYVQGKVYCDTCRVEFETKLSKPLAGVKAVLQCKNRSSEEVTYKSDGLTDKNGMYNITVEGDHAKDLCLVHLGESSDPDCSEQFAVSSDRVLLTTNVGVAEPERFVNPLGFKKKEALPDCAQVLKEMGVNPDDEQT